MSAAGVVYVVDDDPSFRRAVTRMLTAAGLSVQSYSSGTELLAHLSAAAAAEESGCVLADLCMPGLDGLQLQEACAEAGVALPFVFLTVHGDVPSAVSAMRHGAVDFLDKCAPQHALLTSLEQALERAANARAARTRREQLEQRFAALTVREREVLEHVVHGRMNKQIAAALGTVEKTIKVHRARVMHKMRAPTLADLVDRKSVV